MYRRNEISLTPLVPMAKASTAGTASWKGNSKSQFAFANVGVALNVFESSRSSLTSLTLGIGMNRIADFNSRYSFSSESRYDPDRPDRQMPTIADIFSQQMNNFGVRPTARPRAEARTDRFPSMRGIPMSGRPYWPTTPICWGTTER